MNSKNQAPKLLLGSQHEWTDYVLCYLLKDYENATLAGKQKFDLINQDLLLVIDHGITTRRAGAAEATRCSGTRHSCAVQLRGRPSVHPLSVVHPCAPDAAPPRYPHVQGGSVVPLDC